MMGYQSLVPLSVAAFEEHAQVEVTKWPLGSYLDGVLRKRNEHLDERTRLFPDPLSNDLPPRQARAWQAAAQYATERHPSRAVKVCQAGCFLGFQRWLTAVPSRPPFCSCPSPLSRSLNAHLALQPPGPPRGSESATANLYVSLSLKRPIGLSSKLTTASSDPPSAVASSPSDHLPSDSTRTSIRRHLHPTRPHLSFHGR